MTDQNKKRSQRYLVIIYIFLILFMSLAVYLAYFIAIKSDRYNKSAYNPRNIDPEVDVLRGKILASDGTVLAENKSENNTSIRYYPEGNLYSHVVGHTDRGKGGLELSYNKELLTSTSDLGESLTKDLNGEKKVGDNLYTTLDPKLQKACYDAITTEKGAAIVMDAESGAVLAEVSKPTYDPNKINNDWNSLSGDADGPLLNRAVSGLYPPGSTFKIITTLAYLRDGGKLDDTFDCNGSYSVGNYTVHCAGNRRHGHQTLKQAFGNSCNVSFSKIGLSLSDGILKDTAEDFLINKNIKIDQTISKSKFILKDNDSKAAKMATAFGQGETQVTPMQMLLAADAVANGGKMMKPYLVDRIENKDGVTIKETNSKVLNDVMTTEEASELQEMMRYVVTNGTARSAFSGVKYEVFGKTGTAEFNAAKDTHSWFTGFATDGNKKVCIVVLLEDTDLHASNAAKKILNTYFNE